jgi:lysophospholipase L1-like esterase
MNMLKNYISSNYTKNESINQNNIITGDSIAESTMQDYPPMTRSWCYDSDKNKYRNDTGTLAKYLEIYTSKFFMNCGLSGNTIAQLIARWDTHISLFSPPITIINIGINDTVAARTVNQIKEDFETLFVLCTGNTAFMSLPYRVIEDRLVDIIEINSWLSDRCSTLGFLFIDWYAWSVANSGGEYFYDDIHPNASGYNYMAENIILPALQSVSWV